MDVVCQASAVLSSHASCKAMGALTAADIYWPLVCTSSCVDCEKLLLLHLPPAPPPRHYPSSVPAATLHPPLHTHATAPGPLISCTTCRLPPLFHTHTHPTTTFKAGLMSYCHTCCPQQNSWWLTFGCPPPHTHTHRAPCSAVLLIFAPVTPTPNP